MFQINLMNSHSPNANCWTSDGKVAENMSVCLFSFEGIEECSHILTISGRKPANKKGGMVKKQTPNKSTSVSVSQRISASDNFTKNSEIVEG